jgi:hypothetical protein
VCRLDSLILKPIDLDTCQVSSAHKCVQALRRSYELRTQNLNLCKFETVELIKTTLVTLSSSQSWWKMYAFSFAVTPSHARNIPYTRLAFIFYLLSLVNRSTEHNTWQLRRCDLMQRRVFWGSMYEKTFEDRNSLKPQDSTGGNKDFQHRCLF